MSNLKEKLLNHQNLIRNIRSFFYSRNVVEVVTPSLLTTPTTDVYIDSIEVSVNQALSKSSKFYLHTSPELEMKRLLSKGSGDIFQICQVFRDNEFGRINSNEFTMLEFYRVGFDMQQLTLSEQPAYNGGDIDFTASRTQSLQSASDITLSGAFTFGIKLHPTVSNVAVIGSNTTPNEFFKITSDTNLRFKTDNNEIDLALDSGTFIADLDLVVTRNASNLITLYVNGVAQADTETLAGTADINAIGVRRTDNNPYDGTISEIQIYDTESTALTANVNTYLSNL